MKKCSEIKDCISLYIDNELDPDELKAFEEHIASCEDCRKELDEMMQIVGLCKDIPEVELPENFRAELHKKLLEVQGQTQRAGKSMLFSSGYFKLFSSVAAVFLLVFLIRGLYGFDLFQGFKTSNSADQIKMAAEGPAPAQAKERSSVVEETVAAQAAADQYRSEGAADTAGGSQEALVEGHENRSTNGNRNAPLMAGAKLVSEKVTRNQASLVIVVSDPAAQLESIRNIVTENGGVEPEVKTDAMLTVQGTAEAQKDDIELTMSIPNIQYNTFLDTLKADYGQTNVEAGEIITEDMGPAMEELLKRSDSLDLEIEKREKEKKDDGSGQEELDRLNAEKLEIQNEIDGIRIGTDNTVVKILLKKS